MFIDEIIELILLVVAFYYKDPAWAIAAALYSLAESAVRKEK